MFRRFLFCGISAVSLLQISVAFAGDWTVTGTVLTPTGIVRDGAITISDQKITAVGPATAVSGSAGRIGVSGIILPGFIDLHDHLTWNVLPRWIPGRKFANRYEWQDTAEYDRALVAPHGVVLADAACETEIYAELKALAGGATSVIGGLLKDPQHPDNAKCVAGLARNLDTDSGFLTSQPNASECPTPPTVDRTLLDVVQNEVFPLELMQGRMEFLLCELSVGTLRGMVVHLSEGAATDSAAHREYNMLSKEILLQKDGKSAVPRDGFILIHGTALRDSDFTGMKASKVGLVWSPRSNDELYGSTLNIAAAQRAGIDLAIAPDWSPSGSAGMLQEMGYVARRYPSITSGDLIAMATSTPARMARISSQIGSLAVGNFADFIVVSTEIDPAKTNPLDPVVKGTSPANISLVVVGGQPLYGDAQLLERFLPPGTKADKLMVCGAEKAVYLGQTEAGNRGWTLADITKKINAALSKASSALPEIECD
ncbi:MAG TPA: amidohydrolase family protein [Xanthobacteraceae bacterium]|nr:amidohydrolase family protein [Xanthobacteraceae bacterium]